MAQDDSSSLDTRYGLAVDILVKGDIKNAIDEFEELSMVGYKKADVELARLFVRAEFIKPDYTVGCKYAQSAHDAGFPKGTLELAKCYEKGVSEYKLNSKKAASLYRLAFEKGNLESFTLELYNLDSNLEKPIRALAEKSQFFSQLADGSRKTSVVEILKMADAVPRARALLSSNDARDLVQAANFLDMLFQTHDNNSKEYPFDSLVEDFDALPAEIMIALQRSVDQGYAKASFDLGKAEHWKEFPDYDLVVRHYLNAMSKGLLRAVSLLSYRDIPRAAILRNKNIAPEGTDIFVYINNVRDKYLDWDVDRYEASHLAELFRTGRPSIDLAPDLIKAFKYQKQCADRRFKYYDSLSNLGQCLNWLGIFYSNGLGNPVDHDLANASYFSAHDLGNIWAAGNIGESYEEGTLGEVDFEKALNWYEKSYARGNNAVTQDLGRLYELGMCVTPDYKKAAKYYRLSVNSDAPYPEALLNLAGLIERGLISGTLEEAAALLLQATKKNDEYETQSSGEIERTYQKIAMARLKNLKKRMDTSAETKSRALNAGNYYALLIGIENYQYLQDLKTPISDVSKISDVLKEQFGFETTVLVDPSRKEILQNISSLRKVLQEQDNLLIYYAGHGYWDQETDLGFWQPADAEKDDDLAWIATNRITRTLRGIKSNNIAVISDSCFAGVLLRGELNQGPSLDNNIALQKLMEKKTRIALASGGLQPVPDNLSGGANSIFATQFLNGLENSGEAITANALFLGIQNRVITVTSSLGYDQAPEFSALYDSGHEGGDFVFVRKSENNL